jgi:hypothetical protein
MMYMATVETRNYEFTSFADTEKLAIKAMRLGWRSHRKGTEAALPNVYFDWTPEAEFMGDISMRQIPTYKSATGKHVKPVCFCDHDIVWEQK